MLTSIPFAYGCLGDVLRSSEPCPRAFSVIYNDDSDIARLSDGLAAVDELFGV